MSLNNSQMLPARVRNMRQMNDVLNAEDIILAEIERIIDEMYQRASLLHEIVLMHDLYDMTADAFEKIAAELHAEGFEFVTVHELYSIYGKTLEPGKVYFSPKQ